MFGFVLANCSQTNVSGNNVFYLPLRWWMLHLKQEANSVLLLVTSCGNFVH